MSKFKVKFLKLTQFLAIVALALMSALGYGAVTFVHTDHLGSVVAESNSSGSITKRFHYKPFGETIEAQQDDVGYTGHKHDVDIGLTYMQARYYDPVIGRFLSPDPVSFWGHLSRGDSADAAFNRYAYVGNNPYSYTDPDGRVRKLKRPSEVRQNNEIAQKIAESVASALPEGRAKDFFQGAADGLSKINSVSRSSQMTQLKKDAKIPRSQQPQSVEKVKMTDSNGNTVKRSDGSVVNTTEYTHTTTDGKTVVIQDHSAGHKDFGGDAAKPHLNVRPADNTRTGKVDGTEPHYIFDK